MSSSRDRATTELAQLTERLLTVAEALKRIPSEPDRHSENVQRLRQELDAIRAELLATAGAQR
jgi:hypothetical protein